jgi:DNA uptake protein ComE-like DNA-binding protein
MTPRTKKTADSPDSWLIDGVPARSRSAKREATEDFASLAPAPKQDRPSPSASDEASEWLVMPEPSSSPTVPPPKKTSRRAARKEKREAEPSAGDAEQVIEEQRAEIAELSAQVRVLQGELQTKTKLTERVAELEAELAESKTRKTVRQARRTKAATSTGSAKRKSTATRAKASTRSKSGQSKANAPARKTGSTGNSKSTAGKARKNDRLDLNDASFEELRELGLSVTQSARLIAYRDVRGGYESLDEIDDVPGLSEKTRGELKDRLKLGA